MENYNKRIFFVRFIVVQDNFHFLPKVYYNNHLLDYFIIELESSQIRIKYT